MLDMGFAYDVARAMSLDGNEFILFYDDCCNSRAYEWSDDIKKSLPEDVYAEWCKQVNLPCEKTFTIELNLLADEDTDFEEIIRTLKEDLAYEDIEVVSYDVKTKDK